jgi:ATP-dependent RNA/DNA helicase IGHMBP2
MTQEENLTVQHFQRLRELLEWEAQAEEQELLKRRQQEQGESIEKTGEVILHLLIREEFLGFGQRILVDLSKKNQKLPWNRLDVGTPVLLSEEKKEKSASWRGVITQRDKEMIQVALEDWPLSEASHFRLELYPQEVSRQRQRLALKQAENQEKAHAGELRALLLYQKKPIPSLSISALDLPAGEFLDKTLNESQQQAILFALANPPLSIIHGPPGTGKTTTVIELIRQYIRKELKVLVCAPSNIAVDNLLEKLIHQKESVLRLGHPARVLAELREHTLDLMIESHPEIRRTRKQKKEAYRLFEKASRFTRAKPEPGERHLLRQSAKEMLHEAKEQEKQFIHKILDSASIVCSTNTGVDPEILGNRLFDVVVLDEACQCTEPESWIPLLRGKHLVLAGDHCQLPPTILSKEAEKAGLGISLQERLIQHYGESISRRLTVQYRMHETLMNFSSHAFYQGSLNAHPSIKAHCLADLAGVRSTPWTQKVLHFMDTAGAGDEEEKEKESLFNTGEAQLVLHQVERLLEHGVLPTHIAIIAPYAAQVRLLLQYCASYPELEIGTVDGLQGREKEIVILSMVRSNPHGELGFLKDTRRMNVALTRAKRKLIVIGDSATLSCHPFYEKLLQYFEETHAYQSVWEELVF